MGKDKPDESEWFEVSDDFWLDPGFVGKELKLLADSQVPEPVVQEIRKASIKIATLPDQFKHRPDTSVLQLAQAQGRVLLTLDSDFWDDRKHPLHSVLGGIIYVAEPPNQYNRILTAFGLLYGGFAKTYPLDRWGQLKVRAVVNEFVIKMPSFKGTVAIYKMQLRKGVLVAKEVQS